LLLSLLCMTMVRNYGRCPEGVEMRNLITCLSVCVLSGATFADTWTVDDDGKADFDNIQAAINAASDGDEIIVYPGTYTSAAGEVVDMLGKEIWLQSSEGAGVTIIDGEDARRGVLCNSGETSNTIIEGFTITNGHNSDNGGGMFNYDSSPILTDCSFMNNTAPYGGGMYNNGSNSNPTLTNCTFIGNSADYGGGMHNSSSSSPTLTDCTFTGNTANNNGGGMYNVFDLSNLTLTYCTFTNNTAGNSGGGMFNNNNSPTLTNCTFESNSATNGGGGMFNYNNSNPTLTDTTVCGNTPDQIYSDEDSDSGWVDGGGNTITDDCSLCLADIALDDGQVNVHDLLSLIAVWGTTSPSADINFDGTVNVHDLLLLIAACGECE
jgi:hypothetical protein